MAEPTEMMSPDVSVIVPVFNEEACVSGVLEELDDVLGKSLGRPYEILVVDDGSSDGTAGVIAQVRARRKSIRVFRHSPNVGQSFAFHTGFQNARGPIVVTIDGDGQNVPDDIPLVVAAIGPECDCCCGYRAKRKDTFWRRIGSKLANGVRNGVLHETIRDTGCSVKAFKREFVKGLQPWNGMHRFFASFVAMQGGRISQIEVRHRPRTAGTSKYTNWSRLKRTIFDLFAVRWLKSRSRVYSAQPVP
jgi:glycosyltransferase involved in cell wall biosynthesis